MSVLVDHRPEIVSREELMMALWQTDEFISDSTLTVLVSRLRAKIRDFTGGQEIIKTKKRTGVLYRMNPRKIKMPYLVVLGILFFSFHFYFLFLTDTDLADLIYLDVLLVLVSAVFWLMMTGVIDVIFNRRSACWKKRS